MKIVKGQQLCHQPQPKTTSNTTITVELRSFPKGIAHWIFECGLTDSWNVNLKRGDTSDSCSDTNLIDKAYKIPANSWLYKRLPNPSKQINITLHTTNLTAISVAFFSTMAADRVVSIRQRGDSLQHFETTKEDIYQATPQPILDEVTSLSGNVTVGLQQHGGDSTEIYLMLNNTKAMYRARLKWPIMARYLLIKTRGSVELSLGAIDAALPTNQWTAGENGAGLMPNDST